MSGSGVNKVRVAISVTVDTKADLDRIIAQELEDDQCHDRPERSKSETLKMVLRKGVAPGNKNTRSPTRSQVADLRRCSDRILATCGTRCGS